jgi:ribonuclease HI
MPWPAGLQPKAALQILVDIRSLPTLICLLSVYFDGLCQPVNPGGVACYAYLVRRNGKIIQREYGLAAAPYSKDSTNNVAEYTALIRSLEWLSTNHPGEELQIFSDSKLVVSQLNGEFKVKARRIIPLFRKASELRASFPRAEIRWIPREENREADALTNRAYREALIRSKQAYE